MFEPGLSQTKALALIFGHVLTHEVEQLYDMATALLGVRLAELWQLIHSLLFSSSKKSTPGRFMLHLDDEHSAGMLQQLLAAGAEDVVRVYPAHPTYFTLLL